MIHSLLLALSSVPSMQSCTPSLTHSSGIQGFSLLYSDPLYLHLKAEPSNQLSFSSQVPKDELCSCVYSNRSKKVTKLITYHLLQALEKWGNPAYNFPNGLEYIDLQTHSLGLDTMPDLVECLNRQHEKYLVGWNICQSR